MALLYNNNHGCPDVAKIGGGVEDFLKKCCKVLVLGGVNANFRKIFQKLTKKNSNLRLLGGGVIPPRSGHP